MSDATSLKREQVAEPTFWAILGKLDLLYSFPISNFGLSSNYSRKAYSFEYISEFKPVDLFNMELLYHH
jgi:hypothetical protein